MGECAEVRVAEIDYTGRTPALVDRAVIYRATGGPCPEPQDFRHEDSEGLFAEYSEDDHSIVRGVEVETGAVRTYIDEPDVYNECEGLFPDGEHMCLESACDGVFPPTDLWKLNLDGSGRRVRMTRMVDRKPWRATNSNVSPDGRWLAFMLNLPTDEYGEGRGLGLLDLEAWENSPEAQKWETSAGGHGVPPDMR